MATNNKRSAATELEDQLVKLSALVRERRKQLARLEKCPNKHCACRLVWREVVEKKLANQVGAIRRKVRLQPRRPLRTKPGPSKSL
jgi:hypothetical protein